MMNNNILLPIIEILQNEGKSEDEVADVIAEIINTSSSLLYAKMMEVLTDEDMQIIESCPTDEDADKLIARLYSEITGTTLEEVMNVFLTEYVAAFIKEHSTSQSAVDKY
jgi:hypothetical protein